MADERLTIISFTNGKEVQVKPSPDEIAAEIVKAEGGLIRVLDGDDYPVWINPEHIVSVTSHHIKRVG